MNASRRTSRRVQRQPQAMTAPEECPRTWARSMPRCRSRLSASAFQAEVHDSAPPGYHRGVYCPSLTAPSSRPLNTDLSRLFSPDRSRVASSNLGIDRRNQAPVASGQVRPRDGAQTARCPRCEGSSWVCEDHRRRPCRAKGTVAFTGPTPPTARSGRWRSDNARRRRTAALNCCSSS